MKNIEKHTQTTELKHDELKNVQGGGIIDNLVDAVVSYIADKLSYKGPQA